MKRILITCLSLLTLSACNQAPALRQTLPLSNQSQVNAQSQFSAQRGESEESLSARIAKNIFQENYADDLSNGRAPEQISLPRGGAIYESLNRLSLMRKAVYLLSDKVIKREFNKPGTPDQVPAITASAFQDLQSKLQPGDIVLCGNNGSFVHGLIYLGNDQIIHALAQLNPKGEFLGVIKETLSGYVKRVQRDQFVVLRKPGITPTDVKSISDYAHAQVGKDYDSLFLLSTPDRLYCTEILYHALQQISQAPRVFAHRAKYGWDLFTVEDIMDSPDLETVWSYNRQRPAAGQLHSY